MNNAKLIAYLDEVDYFVTDITRDILKGDANYPICITDDEGLFHRFIPLPSPQKSGTETQKLTYARQKAREIVEEIKAEAGGPLDYDTFYLKR